MPASSGADDPTNLLIYPLQKQAERFPINKSNISGFALGTPTDRAELYQGYLEGVGFTERLAYELLTQLGASVGEIIYSKRWQRICQTGNGCKSAPTFSIKQWLNPTTLGLPWVRPFWPPRKRTLPRSQKPQVRW